MLQYSEMMTETVRLSVGLLMAGAALLLSHILERHFLKKKEDGGRDDRSHSGWKVNLVSVTIYMLIAADVLWFGLMF